MSKRRETVHLNEHSVRATMQEMGGRHDRSKQERSPEDRRKRQLPYPGPDRRRGERRQLQPAGA